MIGAIAGDIIGSIYEFNNLKSKEFPLFGAKCCLTDDSVMTIAVAEALMNTMGRSPKEVRKEIIRAMQYWGKRYPYAGYGGRFKRWLVDPDPKPYNSWGNGSAMRVSAAGWLFPTIQSTADHARYTAEVTHNHPEGIRGAEAVASAIFMLRNGKKKEEVKQYIHGVYQYDFSFTLDEIRPSYEFDESCQGTVPYAMEAFFESEDFEDAIRNAISIGGDSDTLAAITGSLAEAYYGVPDEIVDRVLTYLDDDAMDIYIKFIFLLNLQK